MMLISYLMVLKLEQLKSRYKYSGFIYMAFAEEPLVSSNGVPAVAR
jgi:hypothetical protein